eukprot:383830_1
MTWKPFKHRFSILIWWIICIVTLVSIISFYFQQDCIIGAISSTFVVAVLLYNLFLLINPYHRNVICKRKFVFFKLFQRNKNKENYLLTQWLHANYLTDPYKKKRRSYAFGTIHNKANNTNTKENTFSSTFTNRLLKFISIAPVIKALLIVYIGITQFQFTPQNVQSVFDATEQTPLFRNIHTECSDIEPHYQSFTETFIQTISSTYSIITSSASFSHITSHNISHHTPTVNITYCESNLLTCELSSINSVNTSVNNLLDIPTATLSSNYANNSQKHLLCGDILTTNPTTTISPRKSMKISTIKKYLPTEPNKALAYNHANNLSLKTGETHKPTITPTLKHTQNPVGENETHIHTIPLTLKPTNNALGENKTNISTTNMPPSITPTTSSNATSNAPIPTAFTPTNAPSFSPTFAPTNTPTYQPFWLFDDTVTVIFTDCYFANNDVMYQISNSINATFLNCTFDSNALTSASGSFTQSS